jgi:DNA repair protein RadC
LKSSNYIFVLLIKEQLAFLQLLFFLWKGRIVIYTKKLKTITLKVKEGPALENASNSKSAYEIAKKIYRGLSDDQEHFCIMFLDSGNNITGFKVLFSGGMNATTVDLKVVFRNALVFGARSLILVHNHPSNSLNASKEDIQITQEIKQAGKLLSLRILDHIILTSNSYLSMADHALI